MQNNNLNYKNLIKYTDKVISGEIKCKVTKYVCGYTIKTNKIIYNYTSYTLNPTSFTFRDISDIDVYYKKNNKTDTTLYESKKLRDICSFFTSRRSLFLKTLELLEKKMENKTTTLQSIIDNL